VLAAFVLPEIQKRQKNGSLPTPVIFSRAQVLFRRGVLAPDVLLNDEVKGVAEVMLKPGVSKQKGEPVRVGEIEGFVRMSPADPDEQHITLVQFNGRWSCTYAIVYDRGIIQEHLNAAEQFYAVSRFALEHGYWRPGLYNLFCAAELVAKGAFLVIPAAGAQAETHTTIKSMFNRFRQVGGDFAPLAGYADTINWLYDTRKSARYLTADAIFPRELVQGHFEAVGKMIRELRDRIAADVQPVAPQSPPAITGTDA